MLLLHYPDELAKYKNKCKSLQDQLDSVHRQEDKKSTALKNYLPHTTKTAGKSLMDVVYQYAKPQLGTTQLVTRS